MDRHTGAVTREGESLRLGERKHLLRPRARHRSPAARGYGCAGPESADAPARPGAPVVAVAGETRGDDCRGYAIPFTADIRKAMAELTSQMQAP